MSTISTGKRKIAAIFAADVVGYSRLIAIDEPETIHRLRIIRKELFEPQIKTWRGRIFKEMGDCFLAEFVSVVDAVNCAVVLQKQVQIRNEGIAENRRILFRMAINLCDIVIDRQDLQGDGINVAARLQETAEPGGVVVSGTAYDHLQPGKIGFSLEDIGDQHLKNIERPVRAYRVKLGVSLPPTKKRPNTSPTRSLHSRFGWYAVVVALLLVALAPPAVRYLSDQPVLIVGYIGGSKANLLDDPEVKGLLRKKYKLQVKYEILGGRE
jgi:adenylate cyclase